MMTISESQAFATRTVESRNNNFNLLRFLFASLVILGHSPEVVDGDRHREILTRIFGTISLGDLAVDAFFLISGFLIVQSWDRSPIFWDFIKKRVLRIYPGFIVASLISVFIVGLLGANAARYFVQLDWNELFKGLFTLQKPDGPPTFGGTHYPVTNAPLWTIQHEFGCYLLVAVLGVCGILKKPQLWIGLSVTMLFLSLVSKLSPQLLGNSDPLRLMPFFLVGGCFYLFRDRIIYKATWALSAAILVFVGLFSKQAAELAVALLGSYFLFWFAFLQSPFLARFRSFDDISYGIYLYGWPAQKLLLWFVPSLSPWLLFLLSLGASALCGFASWRLVERPFLRLKPKNRQ